MKNDMKLKNYPGSKILEGTREKLTSENFEFHKEYDNEYEKVFMIFWTLQTDFCDSGHEEWLLGPCSKKVAAACHK